ncbi:hypothetical protein GCM10022243_23320 [Saccharothrix violaceirubra]|uniref:ANTAR domain-containing protein n=1 Tax=Saccharothrix violaceirubra TaxID=413306 RepID=A0A7W7WVN8_9PSEU|nr:ANTAR domain-containing protein [Saccharothrix violaceirubra]MBB4964728.1 hypothetical protein [Saccharothrix violaceirubra]
MVGDDGLDDSLTARIAGLEAEVLGLRNAVRTRTVIGQATGLIAAVQGCSPQEGFRLLVRMSQHHNVKLHTIAVRLVDLAAELGPRRAVRAVHLTPQRPAEWPGTEVVEAARDLVEAHDAAEREHRPDERRRLADLVAQATKELVERLAEVGWLPDDGLRP